jgi:hypothetical protein
MTNGDRWGLWNGQEQRWFDDRDGRVIAFDNQGEAAATLLNWRSGNEPGCAGIIVAKMNPVTGEPVEPGGQSAADSTP